MTIRNLTDESIALGAVAHLNLSRIESGRALEPYTYYVDPNNGFPLKPYITTLMGDPNNGPGRPFLVGVPTNKLVQTRGETKVITFDAARDPWYQYASSVDFESLPLGDHDLAFTLRGPDKTRLETTIVSHTVKITIQ